MRSYAASLSSGLPHSGHSGGVSRQGVVADRVEDVDERHLGDDRVEQLGAMLAHAPASRPPALPPWTATRPWRMNPCSTSARAAAMKSWKVLVFFASLPFVYQA